MVFDGTTGFLPSLWFILYKPLQVHGWDMSYINLYYIMIHDIFIYHCYTWYLLSLYIKTCLYLYNMLGHSMALPIETLLRLNNLPQTNRVFQMLLFQTKFETYYLLKFLNVWCKHKFGWKPKFYRGKTLFLENITNFPMYPDLYGNWFTFLFLDPSPCSSVLLCKREPGRSNWKPSSCKSWRRWSRTSANAGSRCKRRLMLRRLWVVQDFPTQCPMLIKLIDSKLPRLRTCYFTIPQVINWNMVKLLNHQISSIPLPCFMVPWIFACFFFVSAKVLGFGSSRHRHAFFGR